MKWILPLRVCCMQMPLRACEWTLLCGAAAFSLPTLNRKRHLVRRGAVRHGDADVETVACVAGGPHQCSPDGANVCLRAVFCISPHVTYLLWSPYH